MSGRTNHQRLVETAERLIQNLQAFQSIFQEKKDAIRFKGIHP
jgi:hypothetical protein